MKYFLIVLFLMTAQVEAANFRVYKEIPNGAYLILNGRIEPGDDKKLEALVLPIISRYRWNAKIALFLSSPGGKLFTAVKMGKMLRKYDVITMVPRKMKCYSSCSLVFMGGWDKHNQKPYRIKHPQAKLAVHRPHRSVNGYTAGADKNVMRYLKWYIKFMRGGDLMYALTAKTHYTKYRVVKNSELKRMGAYRIQSRLTWPRRPPPRPFTTGPMMADEKFARGPKMTGRLVGGLSTFKGPKHNVGFWKNTYPETVPLPVRSPM